MMKVKYENNSYFMSDSDVYLEMQNIREYIDKDGIKRFIVELKDEDKIAVIKMVARKNIKLEDIIKRTKNGDDSPIEVIFDSKDL
jgi:hypothetical protein